MAQKTFKSTTKLTTDAGHVYAAFGEINIEDTANAQSIDIKKGAVVNLNNVLGNNIINLEGASKDYFINASGTKVSITDSEGSKIILNLATDSQTLRFQNGSLTLILSKQNNTTKVLLGNQIVDKTIKSVTATPNAVNNSEGLFKKTIPTFDGSNSILQDGSGNDSYNIGLGASVKINGLKGINTLNLEGKSSDYSVSVFGSNVILTDFQKGTISFAQGISPLKLVFADGSLMTQKTTAKLITIGEQPLIKQPSKIESNLDSSEKSLRSFGIPPSFTITEDSNDILQFGGDATGDISFDILANQIKAIREGTSAVLNTLTTNLKGVNLPTNTSAILDSGTLNLTALQAEGHPILGKGNVNILSSDGPQQLNILTTGSNSIIGGNGSDQIVIGGGSDNLIIFEGANKALLIARALADDNAAEIAQTLADQNDAITLQAEATAAQAIANKSNVDGLKTELANKQKSFAQALLDDQAAVSAQILADQTDADQMQALADEAKLIADANDVKALETIANAKQQLANQALKDDQAAQTAQILADQTDVAALQTAADTAQSLADQKRADADDAQFLANQTNATTLKTDSDSKQLASNQAKSQDQLADNAYSAWQKSPNNESLAQTYFAALAVANQTDYDALKQSADEALAAWQSAVSADNAAVSAKTAATQAQNEATIALTAFKKAQSDDQKALDAQNIADQNSYNDLQTDANTAQQAVQEAKASDIAAPQAQSEANQAKLADEAALKAQTKADQTDAIALQTDIDSFQQILNQAQEDDAFALAKQALADQARNDDLAAIVAKEKADQTDPTLIAESDVPEIQSHSSLSQMDVITGFTPGIDKILLQSFSGEPIKQPSNLTRVPDVTKSDSLSEALHQAFSDIAAGSAGLVNIAQGSAAGTYLFINDQDASIVDAVDIFIRLVGVTGEIDSTLVVGDYFA